MSKRHAHIAALVAVIAQDAGRQKALIPQHLLLLAHVVAADQAVTMTDIADQMGLSYTQTSRLARRLLDEGYIARRQDRHDARLNWFTPTRKGRELDESVRGAVATAKPATSTRNTTPQAQDTTA